MCWMQISVNFLRKDGTKTLDDLEVVHFGRKIPIMFASKPVPSRGVLRKALLHEMCRFEFDNSLQNGDCNVISLLILFEKNLLHLLKQKSKILGGFHKVIAIRHDLKYHVYGGRLNFGDVFSKKNL